MQSDEPTENTRQRAPSQRSLQTRARILDAAEALFSSHGFDGTSLRDIATQAGVQVGLVHHHGGGKEALFAKVVTRRAKTLAAARLEALDTRRARGNMTVADVLRCFIEPYLMLAAEGPEWMAYARLVAQVSADPRWAPISRREFDPTAQVFLAEIAALFPEAPPGRIAAGFVFAVSALLAQVTSSWRITALDSKAEHPAGADPLIAFCAAGLEAICTGPKPCVGDKTVLR